MRKIVLTSLVGLLVVVLVGGWFASQRLTHCAYTPEGKLRWHFIEEWSLKPDYGRDSWQRQPVCDVWTGIENRKPLGTIELRWDTPALGPIIGRVEPDGTGFVALFPPFIEEFEEVNYSDKFAPIQDFDGRARLFKFSDSGVYQRISSLLSPVRDFQGSFGVPTLEENPEFRKLAELDDPRTRHIQCRREPSVVPWVGELVTFGSAKAGGQPRIVYNRDCDDVAYRAFRRRVEAAREILIEASGSRQAIKNEERADYPECENKPCFMGIL